MKILFTILLILLFSFSCAEKTDTMIAEHDVIKAEFKPKACYGCLSSVVIYTSTGMFVYSPVSPTFQIKTGHVRVFKKVYNNAGDYYYYFR